MRRTLIRFRKFERNFENVDRSVRRASEEAFEESFAANEPPEDHAEQTQTIPQRISLIPELADVYLCVHTSIGRDDILVKPTKGNPTGITELYEHATAKESLLKVYDHTLAYMEEKFPKTSVYRTSVENITRARKKIVEEATSRDQIEQKIGSGLLEEILVQAADEFRLAEELAHSKIWEQLEEEPLQGQWTAHEFKDMPPGPR